MSKQHQVSLSAHPNIYNNYSLREFNLYFSEPEHGVNEDTGLLLLIPGFDGNASSNVYKKMRSQFADEYNLVTIQCDYFGQEFMQAGSSVELNVSKEALTRIFDSSEIQEIYRDGFNPKKLLQIGSKL